MSRFVLLHKGPENYRMVWVARDLRDHLLLDPGEEKPLG